MMTDLVDFIGEAYEAEHGRRQKTGYSALLAYKILFNKEPMPYFLHKYVLESKNHDHNVVVFLREQYSLG